MCQLPPDSHWAMRSHMAALARLMPAPDVLPALPPPPPPPVVVRGVVAAGRDLVPTFTTAATGFLVTFCETTLVFASLPSTQVFWRTTVLVPLTPGLTTLV